MNEIVKEWLEYSENDYFIAKELLEMDSFRVLGGICFHSQQCIEKLMKAILILHQVPTPKIHDVRHLNEWVARLLPNWEASEDDLKFLNRHAVESRYPGDYPSREEAEKAFEICTRLRENLLDLLKSL